MIELDVVTANLEAFKIKRFPLFIDLTNEQIIVVGGGNIAERRIKTLLEFDANIMLIAPQITADLKKLKEKKKITVIDREYKKGDLKSGIVIVATNNRNVNKEIARDALKLRLIVSCADARDEGNLWFPAIVNENGLIAAVISEDGNHKKVKAAKEEIAKAIKGTNF